MFAMCISFFLFLFYWQLKDEEVAVKGIHGKLSYPFGCTLVHLGPPVLIL